MNSGIIKAYKIHKHPVLPTPYLGSPVATSHYQTYLHSQVRVKFYTASHPVPAQQQAWSTPTYVTSSFQPHHITEIVSPIYMSALPFDYSLMQGRQRMLPVTKDLPKDLISKKTSGRK